MPPGYGASSYIDVDKQKFQTLHNAMQLIQQDYLLGKVHLRHVYRSFPVHTANYSALSLELFHFRNKYCTWIVHTCFPFRSFISLAIIHRILQSVSYSMSNNDFTAVVYLDEFLVMGATFEELQLVFKSLGFKNSLFSFDPEQVSTSMLGTYFLRAFD